VFSGFVSVFDYSQFSPPLYTSCKPHGRYVFSRFVSVFNGSGYVFSRFVSVFDCSKFSTLYIYIHLVSRTEDMCLADLFPYLTVRVMCLADLFPYLTVVSLVHYIYTSCKPHGRARWLIIFPAL
jgi:hypothetical protein